MFKLTIVAGPLRGNSYQLNQGDNAVGRISGNDIVIASTKISKRHCIFIVTPNGVTVKDAGSSNGTFVNGTLVTTKLLKVGDKVSVGDAVLELSKVVVSKPVNQAHGLMKRPESVGFPATSGNIGYGNNIGAAAGGIGGLEGLVGLPGASHPNAALGQSAAGANAMNTPTNLSAGPPKDLIEKVKFYFDKHVINFLFNLNEKYEWNQLVKGLLGILVIFTAGMGTFPLLDKASGILTLEAKNRAQALARLMIERNTQSILEKNESKLEVGFAEREMAVRGIYIIDMDGRIMAPGKLLNQNLSEGADGLFASKARSFFAKYNSNEIKSEASYFSMPGWKADGSIDETLPALPGNLLGYAEPLKVLDPQLNKNVVIAMAIVVFDLNRIIIDDVSAFIIFVTAIVLGSIAAVGVFTAIHRLTVRPIDHITNELEKVLRGETYGVSLPYQMEEYKSFLEALGHLIQKVPQNSSSNQQMQSSESAEDVLNTLHFMAGHSQNPALVLSGERKIVYLNEKMEEISGVRQDNVVGQDVTQAIPDQAFVLMISDLLNKAPNASANGISDTLEFSGVNYQVSAVGAGAPSGQPKGFIVALKEVA